MNIKQLSGALALGLMLVLPGVASARNDRLHFPVADAAATADAQAKLEGSVKFYWGNQKHPKVSKTLKSDQANKKTNGFNKGDKEGCEWAWLSAMITMEKRAKQLGADAIINLHSIYQDQDFVSETEYECGVGTFTSGVALRGDFVKF
jgi:hypothetical protein